MDTGNPTAAWTSIGPQAVSGSSYGVISGRIAALALDPSDAAGNRLWVGTTGGGLWFPANAGSGSSGTALQFAPVSGLATATVGSTQTGIGQAVDASLSIGAVSVQPGGTGVILAGTGDPNDALDSYYGAGILRSADGGSTWTLIPYTADLEWAFWGEGFAGFAWADANIGSVTTNTVVAAVSQAYEGTLVDAVHDGISSQGLYYSADAGQSWHLSAISDGAGADVQGPNDTRARPDGNAATAVVWNPIRQVFLAAVRYHGYYQSSDGGVTFTRLSHQPGTNLTTALCPVHPGSTGSVSCPIFRGALAVNPYTGDTFAWSTDLYNQDQGLWRDLCSLDLSTRQCTTAISFAAQIGTTALESNTDQGSATIAHADYTLSLAAVPYQLSAGADTILLAGGVDLWKCSLAASCAWINATHAVECPADAKVGSYQHALAWNTQNPGQIYLGNDSGLWLSTDQIGKTTAGCDSSDASHFENLNGTIGSIAEAGTLAQDPLNPYAMLAGLGVNGTVGVNSGTPPDGTWPQILNGQGGPAAIDSVSGAWFVNNGSGVSVQRGMPGSASLPSSFTPVLTASSTPLPLVVEDGFTMEEPAAFLVDPLDSTQLLIATCRVWRGPASGVGWSAANAISSILDGGQNAYCSGNALIRSLAAVALKDGSEQIYAGFYGSANGGGNLAGKVYGATYNPGASTLPAWTDLSLNAVTNDSAAMNAHGYDISSLVIDSHDATGNTVYATVEGMSAKENVVGVYRSTDGGASWTSLAGNLHPSPVSALAIDPNDVNTVYLGADGGVFATQQIANCADATLNCWSQYGTGLPLAPVTALAVSSAAASTQRLTAATYGRGIWQIPLWSESTPQTSVSALPATLSFASQAENTTSAAQAVILTNTGSNALTLSGIAATGDFSESDNCQSGTIAAGSACTVQVTFTPTAPGLRGGQLVIAGNILGGSLTVALSGTGTSPLSVSLAPATWSFGSVQVGQSSASETFMLANTGSTSISITGLTATAPFVLDSSGTACTATLTTNNSCPIAVLFSPTTAGSFSGSLTVTDDNGTQTAALTGTGLTAPTDVLTPTALSFAATPMGQSSAMQMATLTNTGGALLKDISVSISGPFAFTNYCSGALQGSTAGSGESCSIGVVYVPTAATVQSGTLTIVDELRTQTVALTGTGVTAGVISVSPGSLSFGQQTVGTTTAQTLSLANTGGASIANIAFAFTGDTTGSFSYGSSTCGATLASGAQCSVQVIYTPRTSAGATADFRISSTTNDVASVAVPITGNGGLFPATLTVSTTALSFGIYGVGQASGIQTVTIGNSGSVQSLNSLSVNFSGEFVPGSNTCGATLAAQSSCMVGIEFEPTSTGAQSGALTVSSPTNGQSQTVALGGTGFTFTAVPDQTLKTVTSGQTATYTLTITPVGAASSFSLAIVCGAASSPIPHAACTPNPAVTPSLSAQGSAQVQVSTGVATASAGPFRLRGAAFPLFCALLALPRLLGRRRRAIRIAALLWLAILAVVVSSCTSSGGGSGGGSGNSGNSTPAGQYPVTVTVTASDVHNLTRSVNLTLNVD